MSMLASDWLSKTVGCGVWTHPHFYTDQRPCDRTHDFQRECLQRAKSTANGRIGMHVFRTNRAVSTDPSFAAANQ